ncbi:MAG: ribonuclease G [Anaerovoracaceae bacterium]
MDNQTNTTNSIPEPNPTPEANSNPPTKYQEVPREIKKWNWGAFTFNVWWGIGHKVYLPILCIIPLFGIVWVFICGAKGNQWAWETGEFSSVKEFEKCQRAWSRAGLVAFIVGLIFAVIYTVIIVAVGVGSIYAQIV